MHVSDMELGLDALRQQVGGQAWGREEHRDMERERQTDRERETETRQVQGVNLFHGHEERF